MFCLHLVIYLCIYHPLIFIFLWSYYRTMFQPSAGPPSEVNELRKADSHRLLVRSSLVLCGWRRRWTYSNSPISRGETVDSRASLPTSKFTHIDTPFWWKSVSWENPADGPRCVVLCRCSLLLPLPMHQAWPSSSLFSVWKMRSQIRSSLSMVHIEWSSRGIVIFFSSRTNSCVSFANYKFFILFLGWALVFCTFVALTSLEYFILFWQVILMIEQIRLQLC